MDLTQMEGESGVNRTPRITPTNLTSLDPSLRSSYADIAFGRSSPCPPVSDGTETCLKIISGTEWEKENDPQLHQPAAHVFDHSSRHQGMVRERKEYQKPGCQQEYHTTVDKGRPSRKKRRPYEGSKSARGIVSCDSFPQQQERPASASPSRQRRVKDQPFISTVTAATSQELDLQARARPNSAMDQPNGKLESSRSHSSLWSNDGRCPSYAEVFFGGENSSSKSLDSLNNVEQMPEDNVPLELDVSSDLLKQQVAEILTFVQGVSTEPVTHSTPHCPQSQDVVLKEAANNIGVEVQSCLMENVDREYRDNQCPSELSITEEESTALMLKKMSYASALIVNMPEDVSESAPKLKLQQTSVLYEPLPDPVGIVIDNEENIEADARENTLNLIAFKHPTIPGLIFKTETSPEPRPRLKRRGRSTGSKSMHTSECEDSEHGTSETAAALNDAAKPIRPTRTRKTKSSLSTSTSHVASCEQNIDIEIPDALAYDDLSEYSQSADIGYVSASAPNEHLSRARSQTPSEIAQLADTEMDAPSISESSVKQVHKKKRKPKKPKPQEDEVAKALKDIEAMEKRKGASKSCRFEMAPSCEESELSIDHPHLERKVRKGKKPVPGELTPGRKENKKLQKEPPVLVEHVDVLSEALLETYQKLDKTPELCTCMHDILKTKEDSSVAPVAAKRNKKEAKKKALQENIVAEDISGFSPALVEEMPGYQLSKSERLDEFPVISPEPKSGGHEALSGESLGVVVAPEPSAIHSQNAPKRKKKTLLQAGSEHSDDGMQTDILNPSLSDHEGDIPADVNNKCQVKVSLQSTRLEQSIVELQIETAKQLESKPPHQGERPDFQLFKPDNFDDVWMNDEPCPISDDDGEFISTVNTIPLVEHSSKPDTVEPSSESKKESGKEKASDFHLLKSDEFDDFWMNDEPCPILDDDGVSTSRIDTIPLVEHSSKPDTVEPSSESIKESGKEKASDFHLLKSDDFDDFWMNDEPCPILDDDGVSTSRIDTIPRVEHSSKPNTVEPSSESINESGKEKASDFHLLKSDEFDDFWMNDEPCPILDDEGESNPMTEQLKHFTTTLTSENLVSCKAKKASLSITASKTKVTKADKSDKFHLVQSDDFEDAWMNEDACPIIDDEQDELPSPAAVLSERKASIKHSEAHVENMASKTVIKVQSTEKSKMSETDLLPDPKATTSALIQVENLHCETVQFAMSTDDKIEEQVQLIQKDFFTNTIKQPVEVDKKPMKRRDTKKKIKRPDTLVETPASTSENPTINIDQTPGNYGPGGDEENGVSDQVAPFAETSSSELKLTQTVDEPKPVDDARVYKLVNEKKTSSVVVATPDVSMMKQVKPLPADLKSEVELRVGLEVSITDLEDVRNPNIQGSEQVYLPKAEMHKVNIGRNVEPVHTMDNNSVFETDLKGPTLLAEEETTNTIHESAKYKPRTIKSKTSKFQSEAKSLPSYEETPVKDDSQLPESVQPRRKQRQRIKSKNSESELVRPSLSQMVEESDMVKQNTDVCMAERKLKSSKGNRGKNSEFEPDDLVDACNLPLSKEPEKTEQNNVSVNTQRRVKHQRRKSKNSESEPETSSSQLVQKGSENDNLQKSNMHKVRRAGRSKTSESEEVNPVIQSSSCLSNQLSGEMQIDKKSESNGGTSLSFSVHEKKQSKLQSCEKNEKAMEEPSVACMDPPYLDDNFDENPVARPKPMLVLKSDDIIGDARKNNPNDMDNTCIEEDPSTICEFEEKRVHFSDDKVRIDLELCEEQNPQKKSLTQIAFESQTLLEDTCPVEIKGDVPETLTEDGFTVFLSRKSKLKTKRNEKQIDDAEEEVTTAQIEEPELTGELFSTMCANNPYPTHGMVAESWKSILSDYTDPTLMDNDATSPPHDDQQPCLVPIPNAQETFSSTQSEAQQALSSRLVSQLEYQEAESRWAAYISHKGLQKNKANTEYGKEIGGQKNTIAKPLENISEAIKLETDSKKAKTGVGRPTTMSYAQVVVATQLPSAKSTSSLTENLEALLETARITQYLVFQEAERNYHEYRAQYHAQEQIINDGGSGGRESCSDLVQAAKHVSQMVEQLATEIKALGEESSKIPCKLTSPSQQLDSEQGPLLHQMVVFNEAERRWREGLDKHKKKNNANVLETANGDNGPDGDPNSNNDGGGPPSAGTEGSRKPPVTELLLGGLSNLSCNWLDWSTYLSPEISLPDKIIFPCNNPEATKWLASKQGGPPVEDSSSSKADSQLVKLKEESKADVDELGKAINDAADKLSNLDPEQLEQTLHKTWELLAGLRDLEGSGLSIQEALQQFPVDDTDVKSLSLELKQLLSNLVVLIAQAENLNKETKVNRSTHATSDGNSRRSPEGSAAAYNSINKSSSGIEMISDSELQTWALPVSTNVEKVVSTIGQGNERSLLSHQCGSCGAPILISVACLTGAMHSSHFPQSAHTQHHLQNVNDPNSTLLREQFYRSNTAAHNKDNVFR